MDGPLLLVRRIRDGGARIGPPQINTCKPCPALALVNASSLCFGCADVLHCSELRCAKCRPAALLLSASLLRAAGFGPWQTRSHQVSFSGHRASSQGVHRCWL